MNANKVRSDTLQSAKPKIIRPLVDDGQVAMLIATTLMIIHRGSGIMHFDEAIKAACRLVKEVRENMDVDVTK